MPKSSVVELRVVQELEGELVGVDRGAIPSMCWDVGQFEGRDCRAVEEDKVLGATHHF